MKPREIPIYSPELFGIDDRKVLEREFLKIQSVFDQFAKILDQADKRLDALEAQLSELEENP